MRVPFLSLFIGLVGLVGLVPASASAQAAAFDREAAARSLARDFSGCLPDDVPVYAVVTFATDGTIQSITDAKWGSTPKTLKQPDRGPVPESVTACARRVLDGVRIPAFTGAPARVRFRLVTPAQMGCAELVVASERWTSVRVDGKDVGTTALQTRILEGEHLVEWQRADGTFARQKVRATCGHRVAVMVHPDRAPAVTDQLLPMTLDEARRRGVK